MLLQQVNKGLWCCWNNRANQSKTFFCLPKWMIRSVSACIFKVCVWSRPGLCPRRLEHDKQSWSYEYSWQFSSSHRLLCAARLQGTRCFSHMRSFPLHHLLDAPARPPSQIPALPLPDVLSTDLLWHGALDPLPPKKNEKRGCLTH